MNTDSLLQHSYSPLQPNSPHPSKSSSSSLNLENRASRLISLQISPMKSPSNEPYVRLDPPAEDEVRTEQFSNKDTFKTQSKALFQKNVALQRKLIGTNICQFLTPIICLLLLLVVKDLATGSINTDFNFQMNYPFLFNIPYKKLYNNTLIPIMIRDSNQWYLYDFENATDETKEFVYQQGKEGQKPSGLVTNMYPTTGNSAGYFYCQACHASMPYFDRPVNGTINQQLFGNIQYLNSKTYTSNEDTPGIDIMADGAITFYEASMTNLSFSIQINDINSLEYHKGNGVTKFYLEGVQTMRTADGQLILFDLLSKSYLQMINPNIALVSGSQYMPMDSLQGNAVLRLLSMTEAILYPIALSLLLPVFMYTLVLEKEERLREMMKMNGLKMRNYWIVNYLWNILLYIPCVTIFLVTGIFLVQMPFFTETNLLILIITLFGWGLSQVSLSFFFQNFFSKSRTVTIIAYILSTWTTIIASALNVTVFPDPNPLPLVLMIYPPFAFCRIIYDLCTKCSQSMCVDTFDKLTPEMWTSLLVLYAGAVILLILGLYLEEVWPQEYGVAKHPLFFLKSCFSKNKKQRTKDENISNNPEAIISSSSKQPLHFSIDTEDQYVLEEREFTEAIEEPCKDYPLVIKNLRKIYKATGGKPPKVAVRNFSLHIEKGEMFGLLGPNGAGKTSLISMLTGLYAPESGNAWVAGYDIVDQIDLVRTKMGVCPQFDLLWPALTVREHLLFYARMRGISPQHEKEMVEKAIEEVQLTSSADFQTKKLSGGMKRRLSVALALVGDPKIIFLDEPTTGLDPETRRQLWDILVKARGSRAIVLTTHSMEEADVLCTRIGIITQGQLRCIGPQTRLKTSYGKGYHLLINCQNNSFSNPGAQVIPKEEVHQRIQAYIKQILPEAVLKSCFNGGFIFDVPNKGLKVSKIFESLEARKEELYISDWGISQSTLEDVFMEVVDTSDGSSSV